MTKHDPFTDAPRFLGCGTRHKGYPSETNVKRGLRSVHGGQKELVEKLGRRDPCPCGSVRCFANSTEQTDYWR